MESWFEHSEWWFSGDSYDDVVTKEFGHYLDDVESVEKLPLIEQIVVYDQIPRHIYRKENSNHIISYFLEKALQIKLTDEELDVLDDIRFCFAILPLRHKGKFEDSIQVIQKTWQRICMKDSPILNRFLKASYDRCPFRGAIKLNYMTFDRTILKFNPMKEAKYSEVLRLPLMAANMPKIVLSTSGGCDSMLCTFLFANQYPRDKLVVLHINYGNRETSDDEERFVGWWCDKLGLPFYARKISEISRKPCMDYGLRTLYEDYTRNVRYNCYKQFGECLVVLGHNHDDVLENIFTNIANSSKYDNLDGMTKFSKVDGIDFWRPLLGMSKEDIIEACQQMNIPYLPNSTPTWSMRGQIRNKVIPCLDEWNSQFVKGLEKVSTHFRDLYELLDNVVDEIVGKALKTDDKITFQMVHIKENNLFWRTLFSKLGVKVSQKSLDNFTKHLEKKEFKVVLNKMSKIMVKKENNVYYFEISLH